MNHLGELILGAAAQGGEIHDEVMRRVQRDLDLEDSRLEI